MSLATDSIFKSYFSNLQDFLTDYSADQELLQKVVDAPFRDKLSAAKIDLGIVVLLLVNKKTQMIDRVALSNTELAKMAVNMSAKPFKAIKIPIGYKGNMIAEAISSGEPQKVSDWQYLFVPGLTPDQARLNQAGAGIECSVVYPLKGVRDGAALIFSFYQPPSNLFDTHMSFIEGYAKLARQALKNI